MTRHRPLLMAILLSLASSAAADPWAAEISDGESGFQARAGTAALGVTCGDLAPLRRGELVLRVAPDLLAGAARDAALAGAALRIDGTAFVLPALTFDAPSGDFLQPLDIDDPVWAALRAGNAVTVTAAEAASDPLPLTGSAAAIAEIARFCASNWTGPVAPDLPRTTRPDAPSQPAGGSALLPAPPDDPARQFLLVDCAAGAVLADGALQSADFDGDGLPDVVLDAAAYSCGDTRPYCGAAFCSTMIFLSTRPLQPPVDILATGPKVTVVGGRPALGFDLLLETCTDPYTLEGCETAIRVFDGEGFVAP